MLGEPACADEETSDLDSDLDDEADPALAALHAARLAALQKAARTAHADFADCDAANLGRLTADCARLVVHFPLPGVEACDRVDELLALLARSHPGTRFVRCSAPAALLKLAAATPPALAFLRGGKLRELVPGLGRFGGLEGFREERVMSWLALVGALRREQEEASEDEADEALDAPCAACGRTYPHEHIRALRLGTRDQESEDEE